MMPQVCVPLQQVHRDGVVNTRLYTLLTHCMLYTLSMRCADGIDVVNMTSVGHLLWRLNTVASQ